MMHKKTLHTSLLAISCASLLAGCAATGTAIEHHSLQTSTKMKQSIFLAPTTTTAQKTILVSVHNTSDQQDLPLTNDLINALQKKGYTIVTDPDKAYYTLQINILQVGKLSQSAAQQAFAGGFGSTLAGGGVGTLVGGAVTGETGGMVAGGLVGAGASSIADHLVKDVTYTMITDVQLTQKLPKGQMAKQTTTSQLSEGTSTEVTEQRMSDINAVTTRTRVLSMADKVNLNFKTAAPALSQSLANSIAGIF